MAPLDNQCKRMITLCGRIQGRRLYSQSLLFLKINRYGLSKAGLGGFTKCTAVELGSRNIRVNLVEPGFIITDMTSSIPPERAALIISRIPLQRLGHANDVASLIAFLVSPSSQYITGQTFRVDGGLSINI